MAKRLQICSAAVISLSVLMTGCNVDIDNPGAIDQDSSPIENPGSTNNLPVIELIGEPVVTIPLNSKYIEPGVRATDVEDGDISSSVSFDTSVVNTSVAGQYEIVYRVKDSKNAESKPVKRLVIVAPAALDSNVPDVTYVELISLNQNGQYLPLSRIAEGDELDLSQFSGNLINIIAHTEDVDATGSVHFWLQGPVEIDRYENNSAFALANETSHINIAKDELPAGDYSLVVTPYAEKDAQGEAGIPYIVNFTVKASAPKDPEIKLVAQNDSYTFKTGSDEQPGELRPVSENDVYDASAVFTIVKTPNHGGVKMFDLGFFTYTPEAGFTGADSFTYQIAQAGQVSQATVSLTVTPAESSGGSSGNGNTSTKPAAGFTVIKPSADSRLIYVSSSTGSDTNSCLTEVAPCKTIKAGLAKMRHGYPDHMYLKRGDVWRGERMFNLHSGRSATEPAVITYYGTSGPRPRIENDATAIHIMKGKTTNFSFIGLEFYAYKMDPNNAEFTGNGHGNLTWLGGNENILFEDNIFNYTEIVIQEWESGKPTNISLRRNIFTGSYYNNSSFDRNKRPSNLYADGVVRLTIEENVFDYGGWNPTVAGAAANMYNHNMYIQNTTDGKTLVIRNNIVTRASSHGVHGRPGGLFEENFFARNAVALQMGYNGNPILPGVKAQAINNVITEGHSMIKGKNACEGVNLCTPAVWGLIINEPGQGEFLLKNNIVHSLSSVDKDWTSRYKSLVKTSISQYSGAQFTYEGNIAWKWEDKDPAGNYSNPGRTLADYNKSLGGSASFDDFMNRVKTRALGTWDERYTAKAINDYIRAGFDR